MTTLKQQTVSGVKWLLGSSFLQKVIQLLGTVILARILDPRDFGLFALAYVAIDALSIFKSMGFDSALIQKKNDIEKAANTALFIIPLLGFIIYLVLFISSPFIASFMNNNNLMEIIRTLGLVFIISCLGRVPSALLEKNMKFKSISVIEITTTIIYSTTAVVFAVIGMGVWSLVYAYILKTLVQNILFWITSNWKPSFEFDWKLALEMFHFGKYLFLGGTLWFLKMNLDNILVGKILGVTALGFYALSFNISNFIADYFGFKIYRVTFPLYSLLQEDINKLKNAALKIFKFVFIFSIPFGIILTLLSKELIILIYGQKWIAAAPVLKILVWAGVFNTLPVGIGGIILALGKSKIGFLLTLLQVSIFFIFITPMAKLFGLNGVSLVVVFASFISFVLTLYWVIRLSSLRIGEILDLLKPALFSSIIMLFITILVKSLFGSLFYLKHNFDFIVYAGFSVFVYFFILSKFERTIFSQLKELIYKL